MGDSGSDTASLRLTAARARHRWQRRLPWVLGAVGVAALLGGIATLFTTEHDARSAFLLSLGVFLLLIARLGERFQLEGFEILGAKLQVRQVVKRRLELADSTAQGPDSSLRQQAVALQRLAGLYEYVRRTRPPGPERTEVLDALAESMQSAAADAEFAPAEVVDWYREGSDALRVIALNLMLANPSYRDVVTVLEAIDQPRSLFEQYYGMKLAGRMLRGLGQLERGLLRESIVQARTKRKLRGDGDLMDMSAGLLARLAEE